MISVLVFLAAEILCLSANNFLCCTFLFITNLWNLIISDVVMEALLGIYHLPLKAACLGKRFALPVKRSPLQFR